MDLEDKLACVQVVQEEIEGLAGPHVIFEGCNVHVRNATGATPSIDGTGNLIVGYNEGADADRVGSHNLVVGRFHSYANYGGFVAGEANSVRGAAATVSSGGGNSASGDLASVSGGRNNTASGLGASVSGGDHNEANGELSSVSGGEFNQPSGRAASISGGQDNRASGDSASVSGGFLNSAFGSNSSVSGGVDNLAFHTFSTVSGGVREQTDEQNDHEP
jgi:hypothetical protein